MDDIFVKVDKWGECLWGIDENGTLFINEGEAESLGDTGPVWGESRNAIREVITIGEITFPYGASLSGLFKDCRNLEKADLSGFNTMNVSNMSSMFEACINLKELDLSSFNTMSCKDMRKMFANCAKLTNILLGDGFSITGDGSTHCDRLAIKEENKYRRARVIAAEGFKVFYISNDKDRQVEQRQSVPNFRYVIEEPMFEAPADGCGFIGWCTSADGSGVMLKPGDVLESVDDDLKLYAIWAYPPVIGEIKPIEEFVFGEPIPFELPEIESINAPEVSGYLEISPDGSEDSWKAIDRNTILPVSCDGYFVRLHAQNIVGEAVSNAVPIHISRANIDMSSVRWAEEEDMTYTGEPKRIYVEGLPKGIVPVYTGNEATEAGTYVASFTFDFDQDNFNEPLVVREHEWTIKKAVIDMSGVRWNYGGAFDYDGSEHGVVLTGLPEEVEVSYENNMATDAGIYTARASFAYDSTNYEKPQDIMPCVWGIRKAALVPSEFEWSSYDGFVYDGETKSVYITNLPEDASVDYEGASESLAGKYLARVRFTGNYYTTAPAEYEWEIAKAQYELGDTKWNYDDAFVYNGGPHRVELENIPVGLSVRYIGNEAVGAGEYKAVAQFINSDTHNYATPEDMFLVWRIDKKFLDLSKAAWNYEGPFTYDGENKKIELIGLPDGVYAEYENSSAYNAGIYNAHANLKYDADNIYADPIADCRWKIEKKRVDVSDVKWDYSGAFTYDGQEHGVYLSNIPEGITAEYKDNLMTDAGKYVASATLVASDENNYDVPKVSGCTWAVNKSEIPSPKAEWTDSTDFVYDGREKTVEITGEIGDDLTVEYTGNTAKNAGRYYAKAVFSAVNDANYSAPKPVGYSWSIAKAAYDLTGVVWDYDEPFTYDGSTKSVKLVNLPDGLIAHYKNASKSDAGEYTAVAEFEVRDPDNYDANIPDMTLDWVIKKAQFDMSGVTWQESREFSYDGETKSVRLSGLPEGLEPIYENNFAAAAGEYTAKAGFNFDEKNYEQPELAACHWVIDRSPVDISSVRWDYDKAFVYDGNEKSVKLAGVPDGVSVEYSNASASHAGTYVAAAEIIPEDRENLSKSRAENLTWRIDKGDYDMSHVSWDYERAFTYDGSEHRVVLKGLPEGVIPEYRGNKAKAAGKYNAGVTFRVADEKNFNVPEFDNLEWEIAKADYDMSGASWNYDGGLKYTGRMYEILLRGLPDGVRAVYSGNAAADTGSYEASAELIPYDRDNYNRPFIESCKWQIAKADYDMSAVRWDYGEAKVYNGREQSVLLEQLPNGVIASYKGNEGTDVGRYTASAVLSVADPANYNTPAIGDCDWEILPADYDLSGVSWDYEADDFIYDGNRKSITLTELPKNVKATYTGNTATDAGVYTATASFETTDDNFRAPDPVSISWEIGKASYNMDRVAWDYKGEFTYDGMPKRVELKNLPNGVNVSYENNTASDAGTYTATASFEIDTKDYSVPEPMSLEWSIGKADVDIRRLSWDYYQPFTYDGTLRTVKLKGIPDNMEVIYSGNAAVDTGRYTAHADLRPASPDNFNTPEIADCEFEIVKADYDMSDVRWEGEREFVYDGTEKSVTLAGVPEGIEIVYRSNKATGAGRYVASADLVCDEANYNKPSVPECSWHIDKAEYDMSGTAWQTDDEYTYDGSAKSVELTGLPEGVRAVYSGNSATDVGEYEASVEFEYDSDNYIAPRFGACRWNIGPAAMPVDLQAIRWDYDGPFVYDGEAKSVALAETMEEQGLWDRLRGRRAEMRIQGVPAGFEVVYDNNSAKDAGVYYAGATLISMGDINYKPLELPKCKWEIVKAPIDMSRVSWNYETPFTFDGEEKVVALTGLPDTVEVTYTNNRALNAGGYEAMAEVTAKDPDNYETPAPVSACWWHIDKAVYDMSEVGWTYEEELVYDGKEKSVRINGLPEGVRVEAYRGNKAIEAGSYIAEAKLRYRNKENYLEPIAPECKWKIEKKKIDTSEARWDYNEGTLFVYDGKPKEVKLVGVPEDVEVVYIDNSKINAGTYTAKARLSYDTANCEAEDIPDLKWTIEKAAYDTDSVHWTYEKPFEYDGKSKSISLANVPNSIGVRYRDNKASAVGTYTAKAYLTYDSDNFAEPDIDTSIDWSIVRKLEE